MLQRHRLLLKVTRSRVLLWNCAFVPFPIL